MPNWVNGLVNGWVKVNSKHVIFPREEGHHRRERGDSNASSLDDSSSRVLDRSRGKSSRKQSTVTTTSTTQSTVDPEADAIKKFNSKRQNKRRLQRTVSHSDLLREMANGKSTYDNSSTRDNSRAASYDFNRENDGTNDESMRLVAGFFGSDVEDGEKRMHSGERPRSYESSPTKRTTPKNGPVTTGKYLNEAMFVQQLERAKGGRHSNASSAAGSSASAPERSPIREYNKRPSVEPSSAPQHDQEYRQRAIGAESRGIHHESHGSERFQPGQVKKEPAQRRSISCREAHSEAHRAQCTGCNDMESQLLAAYDDIRYLRDVSLRNEYSRAPTKPKSSILSSPNHELTTLADASKRLTEVTGRHRRQIEQMTRETVSVA